MSCDEKRVVDKLVQSMTVSLDTAQVSDILRPVVDAAYERGRQAGRAEMAAKLAELKPHFQAWETRQQIEEFGCPACGRGSHKVATSGCWIVMLLHLLHEEAVSRD